MRETLSDTVALAGGYRGEAKDLVARVERGAQQYEVRLSELQDSPGFDLPVGPQDRITVISRPQSFSVLGASNRTEQVRFPRGRVTLAEAVALAGGANSNQGDAAAVFVFRYVTKPEGGEQPVVYHLNMMKPNAFFLAQRFMIRDQDLLYVGNAQANQPSKMIQLISQLFVPVTTVRATIR
jgi:polysaccharide export outer membrane protein